MNRKGIIISVLGFAALASCGGDNTAESLDGGATTARFSMKLASSSQTSNLAALRAMENDDGSFTPDGSGVTITAARINVKEIRLYMPDGLLCSDVELVLDSNMVCEEEIDDSSSSDLTALSGSSDDSVDDSSDDSSDDSEVEAKITLDGPYVFDLFTGQSLPDLSTFTVPSGVFRKVKFKVAEAKEEDGILGSNDILIGNSIVVEGTFNDSDGASHPFRMALKYNDDFEIKDENGVQVPEGNITAVTASLNVETWFAGTNLQDCVKDGNLSYDANGILVINETTSGQGSCSEVKNTIRENIKNSLELESEDESESDDSGSDDSSDVGDDSTI